MSDRNLSTLFETAASLVVMAEASDKPSVGALLQAIEDIKAALPANTEQSLRDNAEYLIGLLTGIILDNTKDGDADMKAVSTSFIQFQQTLQNNDWNVSTSHHKPSVKGPGDASAPPPPSSNEDAAGDEADGEQDLLDEETVQASVETEQEPFVLPEWVEEQTFRDFIANQPMVLDEIEGDLLAVENNNLAGIAAFKRRIHTLKGEAGVLGLEDMEEVCHAMEDFVDLPLPSAERVDVLLQAKDWIATALEAYWQLHQPRVSADSILSRLKQTHSQHASEAKEQAQAQVQAASLPENEPEAKPKLELVTPAEQHAVTRDPETVAMIGDFLNESSEGLHDADQLLMECEQEDPDSERVNGLFRVFHTIKGVAGFLELRDITELAHVTETMLNLARQGNLILRGHVLDLCFDSTELMRYMLRGVREAVERHLSVPETPQLPALIEHLNDVIAGRIPPERDAESSEKPGRLGELLLKNGKVDEQTLSEALAKQKDTGMRLGEQLVADGKVLPKEVGQALRSQKGQSAAKIKETVKIDLDRVDGLVEMIGELVIVESMVVNADEITALQSLTVRNYLNQLTKITRDLQSVGMRMRMVPVRGVFQKMARMVRDLSRKGGKLIGFKAVGEGTEMDRSMVEHIADPLVHMIRNSVDHGIETVEERRRTGKPEEGTVQLSAYHEGGSIVIEISDDGRGLDRERIRAKAISQGLIKENETISEQDLFALIFHPGFSTAQKVTEISGRGVGMDVVKRNIEAMRGRILIESTPGKGTTFKMILPLTLAIIDGMLISCGNERYIIPTLSIVESIKPEHDMLSSFAGAYELLNVREEILPLIRLDAIFDIDNAVQDPTKGLVVIVESFGRKVGILVDDVISQQQVVIKKVSDDLQNVNFISGAAIMSNGRVGLILNVDEMSKLAEQKRALVAESA